MVLEEIQIPGTKVKAYKIPYLQVDGEICHILVVVGQSAMAVENAVKIPPAYLLFNWKDAFLEYK